MNDWYPRSASSSLGSLHLPHRFSCAPFYPCWRFSWWTQSRLPSWFLQVHSWWSPVLSSVPSQHTVKVHNQYNVFTPNTQGIYGIHACGKVCVSYTCMWSFECIHTVYTHSKLDRTCKNNQIHCRGAKVLRRAGARVTWTRPLCSCRDWPIRPRCHCSQIFRRRCLSRQRRGRTWEFFSWLSLPWALHYRTLILPGIRWCNGAWLHTLSKFTWHECFMFW